MKKKILSLLLLVCTVFGTFFSLTACDKGTSGSPSSDKGTSGPIDYASEVTLDRGNSLTMDATVKAYIDGDTTHFNVTKEFNDEGLLKARYAAINTPESTGQIEEWGKKAANFTKEKLSTASSIVLQADKEVWETDSTLERYLVWVWYKAEGSDTYRNLNIEILQNGLAVGSKVIDTRYAEVATQAINSAKQQSLCVHSQEKDPDFFYGQAYEIDLKELRTNIESYSGARVAFEGTVTYYSNQGVYVENYDEETALYYGIYVYYGYFLSAAGQKVLNVGNRVRIVGNVTYYETGDSYQVSSLKYDARDKDNPDNIKLLDSENKYAASYRETTISTFKSNVSLTSEDSEGEVVTKIYPYAELALATTISMKNLVVKSAYTTDNGGNNDGAISLTCEVDGKTVVVRTAVMKDADGNTIPQSQFVGKTIDVKGIVDYYSGSYQVKVFSMNDIVIH